MTSKPILLTTGKVNGSTSGATKAETGHLEIDYKRKDLISK